MYISISNNKQIKMRYINNLLLALGCFCLMSNVSATNNNKDDKKVIDAKSSELPSADKIVDERFELDDETLGNIMKDFGQHIKDIMTDEVEKLVEDVENKKEHKKPSAISGAGAGVAEATTTTTTNDKSNIEQFKNANKILSKDTQERIEMAGKKNQGELTQSGLMGDAGANKSLLQQVGGKLQSAGTFIEHQISSLSSLAPKLSGKIAKIPIKLRKLMHWPTFLRFKIKFNKVYKSLREELYRQMIYLRTQTIVGVQNLKYLCGRVKHLLKATQFADWTEQEYKKVYDNLQAETPSTTPDIKAMTAEQKEKLTQLARSGSTIFGKPAPEAGPQAPVFDAMDTDNSIRRRRKKREDTVMVDANGKEYNELDDDEDEDMPDVSAHRSANNNNGDDDDDEEFQDAQDHFVDLSGNLTDDEDDELKNELDDGKIVEQFSAQFDDDAGSLDDGLEDIIDSALDIDDKDFEPIDLRKTGCILEPENQDACGACYAYVTMTAASYFNCINSDKRQVVRYNARFLSDCGRYISPLTEQKPKINGCHGGRVSHALKFVDFVGAYEFMDYEFARRGHPFLDDTCAYPRPETVERWVPMKNIPPTPVEAYHGVNYVNLKLKEIDLHLRTVGPVFVNIKVWDGFKDYASGIVDSFKEAQTAVIHSMLIVGHDKDAHGKDYYIIWNSHGTSWGEGGFARVYAKSVDYFKSYIGGLMPSNS